MENNFKPVRCVIVASGYSIKNDAHKIKPKDLPIWDAIQNEFTIGLNYNYRYSDFTVNSYGDWMFYRENKKDMDDLPLIVVPHHNKLDPNINRCPNPVSENTYLLKRSRKYLGINMLTEGIFMMSLVGQFAVSLAVALGFQEIYLLGYDFNGTKVGEEWKTHFYDKEIPHRGNGMTTINKRGKQVKAYKTSIYSGNPNRYYGPFAPALDKIKIVNVTNNSRIETFPKISYKEFYDILKKDDAVVLQSIARNWVQKKLIDIRLNK